VCKKLWVQVNNEPKLGGRSHEGKVPTVLWNEQMQTDATIRNNKPVIVIRVDQKGTCVIISAIEIERMWNVNTNVIPVIKEATGII
jgi:hypothetical protein